MMMCNFSSLKMLDMSLRLYTPTTDEDCNSLLYQFYNYRSTYCNEVDGMDGIIGIGTATSSLLQRSQFSCRKLFIKKMLE